MPVDEQPPARDEIACPEGRDRLGRAHQLRVDIAIAIALAPAWLRRALGERDGPRARSARIELVERVAIAIERRFRVSWPGSADPGENARPLDTAAPLFGGPEQGRSAGASPVDPKSRENIK